MSSIIIYLLGILTGSVIVIVTIKAMAHYLNKVATQHQDDEWAREMSVWLVRQDNEKKGWKYLD